MMGQRSAIRQKALELGFEAVGFAPARLSPEAGARLKEFLAAGKHGEMGWLEARADERMQPSNLWAGAKSVVVVGFNYGPARDPMENLAAVERGNISVYARGKDYHDILKKRLRVLARWMAETLHGEVKLFVDTAPVMEKPLAQLAGLGWQGKHTNMVSREFGSWLFLGEVFTDLELGADAAHEDLCGGCSRCVEVCPTQAITAPYQLDARRCISYLTIEHKGPIPRALRPLMGNRIYGCDDCLAVCPWNKFAKLSGAEELRRAENDLPRLTELAALDDAAFRARFAGSPIKRTGRARFVRNVMIALGNSKHHPLPDPPPQAGEEIVAAVVARLEDESALVRGAAVWALGRLDREEFERRKAARREDDESVRAEWDS